MRASNATMLAAASAVALLSATAAHATDYLFTVNCPADNLVVVWKTGDIDPGKEYLRVATGMNHSGCTVSDYNDARDSGLRRENLESGNAIIQGVPPLQVLKDIFHL